MNTKIVNICDVWRNSVGLCLLVSAADRLLHLHCL